jgi:ubiquinone/menaquinone biosynthesis C-methylase UbiE
MLRPLPGPPAVTRVASRVAHRAPSNVLRAVALLARARDAVAPEPFGFLARPGARPVPLFRGYRASVKPTWASNWWPLATIRSLRLVAPLTPALAAVADAVDVARTLPFALAEVAALVVAAIDDYPEKLRLAGRDDPVLGTPVVDVVPQPEAAVAAAVSYRRYAESVLAAAAAEGIRAGSARMLDVGFGSGSLSYAVAGVGGGEVIGVDPEPEHYIPGPERDRMRDLLAGERANRVTLLRGDAQALEFPDAHFDVVFSATALEHVTDVALALRETARVLRRGGVAYHGVDPWFGPAGGHALCTLDFPWGHVRLTPDEFDGYVREWRPFEADDAAAYRRGAFQSPALTVRQFKRAAVDAGFEIVSFRRAPLAVNDPHRIALDRTVLDECRRLHPTVQPADLLSRGFTVVLRRR